MTKTVSYKTAKGSEIAVSIVTERSNAADHNFITPCYDIEYSINGERKLQAERIDHPQHGPALLFRGGGERIEGGKVIRLDLLCAIPADHVAVIDALIAEYSAEIARRMDERYASYIRTEPSRRLSRDMDRAGSDN